MLELKVNATQRVAGWDVTMTTNIFVFREKDNDVCHLTFNENDYRGEHGDLFELVGKVEIIHPMILWGTDTEIKEKFLEIAMETLGANKAIKKNDYGTAFWNVA